MHPTLQRIAAGLALTTALCAPRLVAAQQTDRIDNPDPNITVQNRPGPDYDPLGIRAGSFLIFPQLTWAAPTTSNVFADEERHEIGLWRCRVAASRSIRTGTGTR